MGSTDLTECVNYGMPIQQNLLTTLCTSNGKIPVPELFMFWPIR